MRISDWSSDVCSSDLQHRIERGRDAGRRGRALCLWIGRGAQLRRASRAPPAERTAGARNAAGVPANAAGAAQGIGRAGTSRQLRELFGRLRSEEHTSELQSLMRISYAVFCLKTKTYKLNKEKSREI